MECLPCFFHLNLRKTINKINKITIEATGTTMRMIIFCLLESLPHESETQRSGLLSTLSLKDQNS